VLIVDETGDVKKGVETVTIGYRTPFEALNDYRTTATAA
jgi:hypothetical protein